MPSEAPRFPRPRPTIGDASSAEERASARESWAFPPEKIAALQEVIDARRDIRRYRPDPVPEDLVRRVIEAGHHGPSVGHSQPWRFIVVSDAHLREQAAAMADRLRLVQAAHMTPERGQKLLDLKLEGLREAPLGVVVACDRRSDPMGVLGRATFPDADMWSCACAIENMWLTARALGLGMGWVTLFEPQELNDLLGLPDGVETLGWLCLGWPDELPPEPGLQRLAWSKRLPLDDVILHERWPAEADAPDAPVNHLRAPQQDAKVAATDDADELLTTPGSLGILDRALDRLVSLGQRDVEGGTLVLVGADHPVASHHVSAYPGHVTRDVMTASVLGTSLGATSAEGAGLGCRVVDAGVDGSPIEGALDLRTPGPRGDLVCTDAMTHDDARHLVQKGRVLGREVAADGIVALGEIGVANTTIATALACALLGLDPADAVGEGANADQPMVERKAQVIRRALERTGIDAGTDPVEILARVGGPEFAVLTGVVLGAAEGGAGIVLDGLAASVCGLLAQRMEPGVHDYLLAGQRSRETAHAAVLVELGLEPLLQLRMRAGEGVGAALASSLLLQGLRIRRLAARTSSQPTP